MSVLIKGMDMPTNCSECPCHDMNEEYYKWCYAYNVIHNGSDRLKINFIARPDDCPLIEVPDVYNIETRSLTNEERKSYIEALKKGAVKTGNALFK